MFQVFCAQGAHDEYFRHDHMDWHTKSMHLPKTLDPNECKKIFVNPNGNNNAELNQFSYNGSFSYFAKLSFQVQIEKRKTPITVTKLNVVNTGVLTY